LIEVDCGGCVLEAARREPKQRARVDDKHVVAVAAAAAAAASATSAAAAAAGLGG
jgi:hypothetical protein